MDGMAIGKMKRKDMDEVVDDFSEFSLSSPARKIRRLDAELPPIMEEEEPSAVPFTAEQQFGVTGDAQLMAEMEMIEPANQERALVLYRSIDPQFYVGPGPSNHSFSVSSDLIPGFKDQFVNHHKSRMQKNENLAVIPYIPNKWSQFDEELEETMDENQDSSMEVDELEERENREQLFMNNSRDEKFRQHCLIPPFPINQPSSPVMWSW